MALGDAFWGFLFGLIFFVPFLGAAIGAGAAGSYRVPCKRVASTKL
jgi:uncharacterized membrane protein